MGAIKFNSDLVKKNYILLVDDKPDNLLVLQLTLEEEYTVKTASNGFDALSLIEESPPDLILLDIFMPEMDGYEVTEKIRANPNLPYIPILLITGHHKSKLVKGLDSGADEFIRKPFQIDELKARVRSLLRLKLSIERRQDFIACLTHDLRTPIVAANRMLNLINKEVFGAVTPKMNEAINQIVTNNKNLLGMLNTVLEVNCYEFGEKYLNFIDFDFAELIKEIIEQLQPLTSNENLVIKMNISPAVQTVKGDRQELKRMFTNLIHNAIKFTKKGFIEIRAHQDEDCVIVEVEDTGIGIEPEQQATIFDRHTHNNSLSSNKGLGLYLCQQIITAHQGSISVKSKLNEGTTFTLKIPVK